MPTAHRQRAIPPWSPSRSLISSASRASGRPSYATACDHCSTPDVGDGAKNRLYSAFAISASSPRPRASRSAAA